MGGLETRHLARARTTSPRLPDDARAQRSREALRGALLLLLESRPFDQIAIKDITEAAGLSYPTFFRRFASKDDLLADIATAEVRRLLALSREALTQRRDAEPMAAMCAYVQAHRQLWRTLLTGGAAGAMRAEFMRISREIAETGPRINPWLPVDLGVPFVTGGIFEILAWWLRQADDYPVENVVKLFNALIVDMTARPRKIALD